MKEFIHEKFIAENGDEIKRLPDGKLPDALLEKLKVFAETKVRVYAMHDNFKKNERIKELDLLSHDLMEQVQAEIEEVDAADEKQEQLRIETETKDKERLENEEKEKEKKRLADEALKKKKKSNSAWGWFATIALLAGAAVGIASANKK